MSENNSNSSPWFAVSIGLMGLIVGYFVGTMTHTTVTTIAALPSGGTDASAPAAPTPPAAPTGTAPTTGVGPTIGKSDATVTLVEFTDFQCPFCGRHYTQTFGQIKKDYVDTGKIKYEIRNFPLTSIHPNAMVGAEAAMCANKQGKFWEMHDKLFSTQDTWSVMQDPLATLKKYGADLGLDTTAFNTCLDKHETKDVIQKDLTDGATAGIQGTPGFWIIGPNGKTQQISGAYPYSTFQADFDAMLKS